MADLLETLRSPLVTEALLNAPEPHQMAFAKRAAWLAQAHDHQILPPGDWWSIWLLLAGRGAGKTRTAAEQIWWWAWEYPNTRWLVSAPTSSDVRSTCFEGDSGLLSVIPPILIGDYNKALHELKLTNGSLIKGIPASEPERFRGPQFHGGWCCSPGTMIALPGGGQKAIEEVVAGDVVMTRHGPRRVLVSCVSGNPADLVSMDCGETRLTVTSDHPILVGDQWIPAGDIKEGDCVWAISTSGLGTRTGSFTSSTLGQSQKAGSFITRTKTRATTILQTLRRCLVGSISAFTLLGDPHPRSKSSPPPQHSSLFGLRSRLHAFIAALDSLPGLPQRSANFAHEPAWRHGETTGLSPSFGIALSADRSTSPKSDFSGIAANSATTDLRCEPIALRPLEVLRVERLPNSKTYSLTVEGEHEFIANGIVVHNCDELAAWDYLQEAWDQMQFGMRLKIADDPDFKTRLICTTTPKPKDLIVELVGREGDDVHLTTASTYSNINNLSENFRKQILQYEGTKLGRQEIYAEILDPEDAGIVKRSWFRLWPADKSLPKLEYIVQSYDCAFTDKAHNDPTAAITFGVFKPQDGPMSVLVIDAWQDRLQYPDLKPKVLDEYEVVYGEGKDARRVDLVLIEEKAAGISLIQDLQRAHVFVRAYNPGRADKMQRLSIVANIIRAGRVWIPESSVHKGYVRDWAEGMVSQICAFPETTHDDFCDAMSQALRYLRDAGWLNIDPPPPETYDEEDVIDAGWDLRKKANPYAS